ncbi:hypothetical protein [Cellulosimicrobium sp. Marseille-Q4280]|uniref:hypothetical protein n=1 Tax=Cellulosimicrobium sp. Marseille-Q4280 TaxID=2937992 RepID=UPI00203F9018|nr:hypothetical protein [Cellulosimicrobium sp. Marseille-Q4280]
MATTTVNRPSLPAVPQGCPAPSRFKLLLQPLRDGSTYGTSPYAPFVLKIEFEGEPGHVSFDEDSGQLFALLIGGDGRIVTGRTTPALDAALAWSSQVWAAVYRELLTGGIDHLRLWALAAGFAVWEQD